jgi:NADH:ubiquinone oxidoreductase subunit 4 (subunit M)
MYVAESKLFVHLYKTNKIVFVFNFHYFSSTYDFFILHYEVTYVYIVLGLLGGTLLITLVTSLFFNADFNSRCTQYRSVKALIFFTFIALYVIYSATLFLAYNYIHVGWPYKFYFSIKVGAYFTYTFTKFVCCLDGVSIIFLILTTFLVPIAFAVGVYTNYLYYYEKSMHVNIRLIDQKRLSRKGVLTHDQYYGTVLTNSPDNNIYFFPIRIYVVYSTLYLLLECLIFLIFLTTDYLIFYVLFETIMIPLYLLMGITGSRINRIKASYYLLFFTLITSIFFLIGVMYISRFFYSTNMFIIQYVELSPYLRRSL